jgi:hypothetical protein
MQVMKTYIKLTIKAHVIRGAFYLLLLVGVCVIPFALGQRTTGKQSTVESAMQLPITSSHSDRAASGLPTGGGLWNQYDNPATEPPLGIGSQEFEPAMAVFSDQAADDFVLNDPPPPPLFRYINGVAVMGEYSAGGGPASSFNVYFYANGAGNLPGAQFAAFLNRPYSGTPPNFMIYFTPFSLPAGTYWVSVQAVQDFNPNGQWFWHNRTVQSNAGAAWQNPGDGYGTGCTNWNRKNACMPDQIWPDQVFSILGFIEGPTPTATVTPTCCQYATTTGTESILPGTTDMGNHCDNCTTLVIFPFPVRFYTSNSTQAYVNSNGSLLFTGNQAYSGTSCPLPDPNLGAAILPYQDDLRTDGPNDGVFTLLTGTAPNRVFNIEWRTTYSGRNGTANFEVRFYESQLSFDIIYGATADNGAFEESGAQLTGPGGLCAATTFSCHEGVLTNGLKVTYSCGPPFTPTPTVTATFTPTPTATVTPTASVPPSPSPTVSEPPTPTVRPLTTPRPRPTPAPRP